MKFTKCVCVWQKREREQRKKLQHFLTDLALLGSLQVSPYSSRTRYMIVTEHLNNNHFKGQKTYYHQDNLVSLHVGFPVLSALAEGERGATPDSSQ